MLTGRVASLRMLDGRVTMCDRSPAASRAYSLAAALACSPYTGAGQTPPLMSPKYSGVWVCGVWSGVGWLPRALAGRVAVLAQRT